MLSEVRNKDLVVNGKPVSSQAAVLSELLQEQEFGTVRVATALNGQFVAAAARSHATLKSGDRIEIVSARQGG